MKKVLYISNIEVPYRVNMFNEFAQQCNLTVLYERKKSSNRVDEWAKREKIEFSAEYLNGINIRNESTFSLGILKHLFRGYDEIIIGCYNSPVQMLAILVLKMLRKPYILNLDGEPFLDSSGLKSRIKKFFIKGAKKYLVAGEKSADSLRAFVKDKEIIPYYFSSLSNAQLLANATKQRTREEFVLVVGQYLDVKGMDVALNAARANRKIKYKFVGMGSATEAFIEKFNARYEENVEIIPFLNKQELEVEYQKCAVFVLPSRKECWGLVINEAASFGTPIVSTWGSGSAVEFLADKYEQFLAQPGNTKDLLDCIQLALHSENLDSYSQYLIEKSKSYSIENGVCAHCCACGISFKGA